MLDADGTVRDLRPLTADVDGPFLAGDGPARARAALDEGALPALEGASGLRVGPPVARPTAVVCIGLNYAAHAAESGVDPPVEPVIFLKHPNTVVGPHDDILLPPGSTRTDWEVELAVVIGRRARYLRSREEAMACVAGYTVSNDVSERHLQLERSGGQWSKGKCCETFNPLGPVLVTADELDPGALRLGTTVNGEVRQDSSTTDLVTDVADLVLALSQVMALEPGDVVNTGTPEGVALSGRFPYLAAGDEVACTIEGIGTLRSTVREASVEAAAR